MIDLNNLRLEIDVSDPNHGSHNMIVNPSSERGTYGWGNLTGSILGNKPILYNLPKERELLRAVGGTNTSAPRDWYGWYNNEEGFAMSGNPGGPSPYYFMSSTPMKVTPGKYVRPAVHQTRSTSTISTMTLGVSFDGGAVTWAPERPYGTTYNYYNFVQNAVLVPAGVSTVQMHIRIKVSPTDVVFFTQIRLNQAATASEAQSYWWFPYTWQDILSPVSSIEVNRAELEVGTLSARIKDSTLDPANMQYLVPGRQIRLRGRIDADPIDDWQPIFYGRIRRAEAKYNRSELPDIELFAVDPIYIAANTPKVTGYGSMAGIAYSLNAANVPNIVNGDLSYEAGEPGTVVTTLPDATLLDHVNLIKDTEKAYAWGDRTGVLNVWDRDIAPINRNPVWLSDEQRPTGETLRNGIVNPSGQAVTGFEWKKSTRTGSSNQLNLVPSPEGGMKIVTNTSIAAGTYAVVIALPRASNDVYRESPGYVFTNRYRYLLYDAGIRVREKHSAASTTVMMNIARVSSYTGENWDEQVGWSSVAAGNDYMTAEYLWFDENERSTYSPPTGPGGETAYDSLWHSPKVEIRVEFTTSSTIASGQTLVWIDAATLHFKECVETNINYSAPPSNRHALEITEPFHGDYKYGAWLGRRHASASTYGPDNYIPMSAVDKGYDTDAVINYVVVNTLKDEEKLVEIEGKPPFYATENTATKHGPYGDQDSIDVYGLQKYEGTIIDGTDPVTWAGEIIDAYKTPSITIRGASWPVKTQNSFEKAIKADLYDEIGVIFDGNVATNLRVTRLQHQIEPGKWTVNYGFGKRKDSTLW